MFIENDVLRLEVTPRGGEIASLIYKEKNLEVMWQGDENHWSGKNPTLFPMVGSTWNKTYQIDNQTYSMKNHGLVRYADLECVKKSDDEIVMQMVSDEHTRSQYPFDFTYQIHYKLIANRVLITYEITNDSDRVMPFTFGLHPGFNVRDYNHSELVFACPEEAEQLHQGEQVSYETVKFQKWQLSHEDIERNATIIYKNLKSPYVDLKMPEYTLRMSIEGYPFLALWSSDAEADFLCIEPWYGHGDFGKVEVPFEQREGMMSLSPNKKFMTSYWFEIN